jgi:hypothetical protein
MIPGRYEGVMKFSGRICGIYDDAVSFCACFETTFLYNGYNRK